MKPVLPAIAVVLALGFSSPVNAAPNAQLVSSVQHRLNAIGFSNVDARELSTAQIAALHMKLQGPYASFGYARIRTKQEVKVILNWED